MSDKLPENALDKYAYYTPNILGKDNELIEYVKSNAVIGAGMTEGLLCLRAKPFRGRERPPEVRSVLLPLQVRLPTHKIAKEP